MRTARAFGAATGKGYPIGTRSNGDDPAKGRSDGDDPSRATSPVVGVVLLVGITVTLAAVTGAFVAFGHSVGERPPEVTFEASLDATDGWRDGQRLRITHRAGEPVAVADLALVVAVPRADARARLTGFPTRRLTPGNYRGRRGRDVFDNSNAGVEGPLDAAETDGTWTSGETASLRFAQRDLDLRPGDRVRVRIVHRPTNAALARLDPAGTGS